MLMRLEINKRNDNFVSPRNYQPKELYLKLIINILMGTLSSHSSATLSHVIQMLNKYYIMFRFKKLCLFVTLILLNK